MNSNTDFLETISANCNPRYSLSSSPTATTKGFNATYGNNTDFAMRVDRSAGKHSEPRGMFWTTTFFTYISILTSSIFSFLLSQLSNFRIHHFSLYSWFDSFQHLPTLILVLSQTSIQFPLSSFENFSVNFRTLLDVTHFKLFSASFHWAPGDATSDIACHGQLHSDEEEISNKRNILTKCFRVKVAERIKKSLRGLILTLLIAFCWVGTLHLLKLTFNWNEASNIMSPSLIPSSSSISIPSSDDLIDSTLSDDEDDFEERLFNVSWFVTPSIRSS